MPSNLPSGTKVNCRSLKSGNGPDFARMPNDTVSLDLSNYGLSEVRKYMFSGLPYLQRLFLQGNGIKVIEDHSFRTLGHLQYIDLSRYVKAGNITYHKIFLPVTPRVGILRKVPKPT